MPTLRVVLDTNVLFSGIGYPTGVPGRILGAWHKGSLEVILSTFILEELARILPRLDYRLKLEATWIADVIDTFAAEADLVEPESIDEAALRDGSDIPVLGTLLASKADYLITGDKDLLTLTKRYSTIISPADFWRKHGA